MLSAIILCVFFFGYFWIILEHKTGINKAATALLLGVACWVINFVWAFPNEHVAMQHMNEHLGGIGHVVFYVLGAMVIVGLIEAHDGFRILTDRLRHISNKKTFFVITTLATFFLSAILDNMTTVIVMITLVRPLLQEHEDRLTFAAMIVIAANAGGAWSPIGDVTTTMLWIDNKVSASYLVKDLFLPSLVSAVIPLVLFVSGLKGDVHHAPRRKDEPKHDGAAWVFWLGVGALIFVPILRAATGVPPYMGIMLGMGVMWMFTDLIHQEHHFLRVPHVLTKIDISSVLFFLGILLAVAALESVGIFRVISGWLNTTFGSTDVIVAVLGVLSSVFDNVPLTAAIINMYDLPQFPMDSPLWHLTAYCVGTGGSLLVIGSAAGIVAMSLEGLTFGWYLRRVTLPVFLGYLAGLSLVVLI